LPSQKLRPNFLVDFKFTDIAGSDMTVMMDSKQLMHSTVAPMDLDVPSVTESEVSSDDESFVGLQETPSTADRRAIPSELQWKFYGLTLWLELEEFDQDLSKAIDDLSNLFNVEKIPQSHITAIYGMTHLSANEAKQRLHAVKDYIPKWPSFSRPTAVVQDIAEAGRPGQVCSVAWGELTFSSNAAHEDALDELYEIFFLDEKTRLKGKIEDEKIMQVRSMRNRPWKPHNSVAYDNPDNSPMSLGDMVQYVASHPTLLTKPRRVNAISLWDTNGTMGQWNCLDRVYF